MESVEWDCPKHECNKEWFEISTGKSRYDCPGCWAGAQAVTLVERTRPLIRFSQTWGRDRALTQKEKRFKPLARGD